MANLGMVKNPAIIFVATETRAHEIYEQCEPYGWIVIIGVEPDEQEDISYFQRLMGLPIEIMKNDS